MNDLSETELRDLLAWAEGRTSGRGADMSAMPLTARLIAEVRRFCAAPRLTLTAEDIVGLRLAATIVRLEWRIAVRTPNVGLAQCEAALATLDKLLAMADAGGGE